MTRAERATGVVAYHAEGPFWDAATGSMLLVDMLAGDVLTLTGSGVTRRHVGDVAAVVRARAGGGYVAALERTVALLDADWRVEREVPVLAGPGARLNEGGCDPHGRFFVGSMADGAATGAAALYRIGADLAPVVVLPGVTISNGLQWSADGRLAYYNDTPTGRVDVIEVDEAGGFGERRPFAVVEPPGQPDGLAIDDEGGLWVALWGGSRVERYGPDGALTEVVELPVPHVTSCAFGGEGQLYITTTRERAGDDDTVSGSVFVATPGVRGAAVHAFAG